MNPAGLFRGGQSPNLPLWRESPLLVTNHDRKEVLRQFFFSSASSIRGSLPLHSPVITETTGDKVSWTTMSPTPPVETKTLSVVVNKLPEITSVVVPNPIEKDVGESATGCPPAASFSTEPPPPPFSVFTAAEKQWISYIASFGAMFSTLSSYIYFPALVPMANDLGVSVSLVNLTVTSYLIVAGIAPAFMGDIADQGGRRPAYILMFILVAASNIGLALRNSYAALFVLRMVQSAGVSGE